MPLVRTLVSRKAGPQLPTPPFSGMQDTWSEEAVTTDLTWRDDVRACYSTQNSRLCSMNFPTLSTGRLLDEALRFVFHLPFRLFFAFPYVILFSLFICFVLLLLVTFFPFTCRPPPSLPPPLPLLVALDSSNVCVGYTSSNIRAQHVIVYLRSCVWRERWDTIEAPCFHLSNFTFYICLFCFY